MFGEQNLSITFQALEQRLAILEQKYKEKEERIGKLESEVDILKSGFDILKEKVENLESVQTNFDEIINILHRDNNNLRTEQSQIKSRIDSFGSSSKTPSSAKPEDSKLASTAEEIQCAAFVKKVDLLEDTNLVSRFIGTFSLETNSSNLRWQAHSLLLTILTNSDTACQREILDIIWSIWFQLPNYGRKANQVVDLIEYFIIKCASNSSPPTASILYNYAKKMISSLSQTEVKIVFPLPIVACNPMIEYDMDFYGNLDGVLFTGFILSFVVFESKYLYLFSFLNDL